MKADSPVQLRIFPEAHFATGARVGYCFFFSWLKGLLGWFVANSVKGAQRRSFTLDGGMTEHADASGARRVYPLRRLFNAVGFCFGFCFCVPPD